MANFTHKTQCPECAKQGRDSAGDNLAVYSDGSAYCFACQYTVTSTGYKATRESQNKARIDMDITKLFKTTVSEQVLTKYGVKSVEKQGITFVAFPIHSSRNRQFLGHMYREVDLGNSQLTRNFTYDKGIKISDGCLFGFHLLSNHKTLYVCEGITDTLALASNFGSDSNLVVGIPTTKVAPLAAALIKRKFTGKVVLCLDNDEPGYKARQEFYNLLGQCTGIELLEINLGEHNDVTDALAAGDLSLFKETHKVQNLTIKTSKTLAVEFPHFVKSLSSKASVNIRFSPSLNKALKIMPGKLISVLGDSGQGKSSLVEQISLEVLEQGKNVLFTSCEMHPGEITLKFVRMVTGFNFADEETTDNITPEDMEVVDKTIKNNLRNLCVGRCYSVTDVENQILEQHAIGLNPDLVVVDHILGVSAESSASEIERSSSELKKIAEDYNCCVMVLSHVSKPNKQNRGLYRPTQADAYGSGGLTRWSDVMLSIALDFDNLVTYLKTIKYERLRGVDSYIDIQMVMKNWKFVEVVDGQKTNNVQLEHRQLTKDEEDGEYMFS